MAPVNNDRAAWNLYWVTFAVLIVVLVGLALARGTGPVWAIAVTVPVIAAGLNLVFRSDAHARVCAIEVSRHGWLRLLTMGGYSQRTFFATGILLIAVGLGLGAWVAGR